MDRIKIRANTKKIGDEINGKKITNLGKIWSECIDDADACCYGEQPGQDYLYISFQYAYFN